MLTKKDKQFLIELRKLLEKHAYEVVLKTDGRSRMVLRSKYGDGPGRHLNLSRQNVHYRFQHVARLYVAALESIYIVESTLGPYLREYALAIARERVAMWKKATETGLERADLAVPRRQTENSFPK